MIKSTKIYFALIFFCIIATVATGFYIRGTFAGNATVKELAECDELDEYIVSINEESVKKREVSNLKELEDHSSLIVKVRAKEECRLYAHEMKRNVEVLKVYKTSDNIAENDILIIDEPSAFLEPYKNYSSFYRYNVMQAGKEYILFLGHLETVKGYNMSKEEEITFFPSTDGFSLYMTDESDEELIDEDKCDNGEYKYGTVKNYGILTTDKKIFATYEKIKEQVINNY